MKIYYFEKCLGHKGMISSLLNTGGEELKFISSSGDGSVKQWTPNTRYLEQLRSRQL